MKKMNKKLKTRIKIVGATMTTIFSLFSVFAATYAWFSTNENVNVTGGSVRVQALQGIQFDFYYLDHFAIDESTNKDGNFDTVANAYAGYELPASNPVFRQINYDENGQVIIDALHSADPTSINHLWPAHRLTYAIAVTSGNLNSFSLETWGENRLPTVLTRVLGEDVEISLSWAINIYGGAYYVTQTNNIADDIATGFTSFKNDNSLTDKFPYNESLIAPESNKPSLNIVNGVSGDSSGTKRIILYFSIEFSNDESTFYSYSNPYYVKDTSGNSNCYEKLSLTGLSFKIAQRNRQ